MNFGELRDRTAFLLNFNDGQADQDFTSARLKQAINMTYNREVMKAQEEGSRRYFKKYVDVTWPASSVTLALPNNVKSHNVFRMEDVTDADPGQTILTDAWFLDSTTLK